MSRVALACIPLGALALVIGCTPDGTMAPAGSASAGNTAGNSSGDGDGDGGGEDSGGEDGGGDGDGDSGGGLGDDCSEDDPCASGLVCEEGSCVPGGTTEEGGPCLVSEECADGLQCINGSCVPEGAGEEGDACESNADCEQGLVCALVGFSTMCVPGGTGGPGDDCDSVTDCYAGLSCLDGTCAPTPPGLPGWAGGLPFDGVECEDTSDALPVRAYFEVPGASGGQPGDFFRMPFPSDVAIVDGSVDYTGFPTPGGSFLGFDPVQRYLDAIDGAPAWSNSPTVIFRFSGPVDLDSFLWNEDDTIRPSRFVDVTTGAPDYGRNLIGSSFYNNARSNYVCPHWRSVRPPRGEVLEPGHSYAIYYTDDVTAMDGSAIQRSPHFAAMLGGSAPSDPALADAWSTFQPLRDYLAFEGTDPDTIINGVVITVGDPHDPMEDIAASIQGSAPPTATNWVKCGGGAESPCPQADADEGRACGEGTAGYDEYHAMVELPVFQEGNAPYLESGGAVDGSPVGTDQVCMSLTVPKASQPAGGWPLVVYAHGTNGSFRSHLRSEVAGALSSVNVPGGDTVRFAVLGVDMVGHGPRRGDSDAPPSSIFFNFANPDAAEGNSLQAGADVIALARFGAALDLDAATTGGDAIAVDPDAIVFFGHSQGALAGALGAPYAPEYQAVVLSGGGGSLIHSLLEKKSPVDIAAGLPFVIQDAANDGTLRMGERHPVLALLQHYIDAADPFSHAGRLIMDPAAGPHHTFVTYGIGDSFTPNKTTELYTIAAGLEEGTPDGSASPADDLPIASVALPAAGNIDGTTGVMRQYGPPGDADGHLVVFDVDNANDDVVRFLGMAANGQVPQVGQ